jgi:hypothetical protein
MALGRILSSPCIPVNEILSLFLPILVATGCSLLHRPLPPNGQRSL